MNRRASLRMLALLVLISSRWAAIAATPERVVDMSASDGVKLKGTFFAAGKPGPGVLLLHQCNKDRQIWNGLARELADSGINVMTLDLRNFGESGGTPSDNLSPQEAQAARAKWPSDIDKAYDYLVSQPGVKRDAIGVGGASCGVDNSVQTAIRHPEVKSLVLLAGPADVKGREFLRSSAKLPILFGYADDDEYPVTIKMIQWLYSISPCPGNRMVSYDKGGHGAEIFAVHPEFKDAIRDWYRTTLITTPGRAPETKRVATPQDVVILDQIERPDGAEKVSKMLKEARAKDPKAQLFPEDIVNGTGYEHLQAGDTKGAVAILKLNVEAHPDSANAYDSVSDAYLADGQRELARQSARKALELLPTDPTQDDRRRKGIKASAENKLKQLEETPK
jgi:dienelactone hydrolase